MDSGAANRLRAAQDGERPHADDMTHYFAQSEQIVTAVSLAWRFSGGHEVGWGHYYSATAPSQRYIYPILKSAYPIRKAHLRWFRTQKTLPQAAAQLWRDRRYE